MSEAVVGPFAWLYGFSEPLGWVVVAVFIGAALLEWGQDRETARPAYAVAWVVFAAFWLSMVYYFVIEQKSVVEGVGVIAAVPLSAYVAALLWSGRDSLFLLSRAVAAAALIYMPLVSAAVIRQPLIEAVTDQTAVVMQVLGREPQVVAGEQLVHDGRALTIVDKEYPYESTFVYIINGEPVTYTIKIACTGIGSMAIVAGLVAAVRAPLHRKVAALAVSLPVIYVLNIVRNVFISLSLGEQHLQVFPELIASLFALDDVKMVSYIVADRLIAQSLSVVVLVGILYLIIQRLPEVLTVVDDVLYLLTGRDTDLRDSLGL